MAERKIWTPYEDKILREIIEVKGIKKWSQIARCMETDYKTYGRTGKQCRERWHNQLDPHINNTEWTRDEEEVLFRCHNEFGNKWAKIALYLKGRTDNNIKNHFYSTLRKGLRKLNKFILDSRFKGKYKELKGSILSKLTTVAEDKFDQKLNVKYELRDRCVEMKKILIELSKDEFDLDDAEYLRLADNVVEFNRTYRKRKSKKRREYSEDENDDDTLGSSDRNKISYNPPEKPQEPILPNRPTPIRPVSLPLIQQKESPVKPEEGFINLIRRDKSQHEYEFEGEIPLFKKNSSRMGFNAFARPGSFLENSNNMENHYIHLSDSISNFLAHNMNTSQNLGLSQNVAFGQDSLQLDNSHPIIDLFPKK